MHQIGEESFLLGIGALELGRHRVDRPAPPGELLRPGGSHPCGEVPVGQPAGGLDRPSHRPTDRPHQHGGGQPRLRDNHHGDEADNQRHLRHAV